MVSDDVTIRLGVDTTQADAEIATLQSKIDRQATEWQLKRQQIINEMQNISSGISDIFMAVRLAAQVTGQALDPIFNALMATVSATVSLMIATATALAAGSVGILGWISIALTAAAVGYNVAQFGRLLAEKQVLDARLMSVESRVAAAARSGGVMFG
jgi:hypothetical protein